VRCARLALLQGGRRGLDLFFASRGLASWVASELLDWAPRLTEWAIQVAVRKLSAQERARYSEEWLAGVEHIPGRLSKLLYAIDLIRAAHCMRKTQKEHVAIGQASKRTFDLVVACTLLAFVLPLLLLIVLIVGLTGRPIFWRRPCIGRDGRVFICLRFRTMAPLTEKDDFGTTAIGTLLRQTGLDELPQLINVIRGEMSLIAPQPRPWGDLAESSKKLAAYVRHRPGLVPPTLIEIAKSRVSSLLTCRIWTSRNDLLVRVTTQLPLLWRRLCNWWHDKGW
jgi:lipopolysaccharide/colanic/teichoic acid biosynthesis glycosyltransferase